MFQEDMSLKSKRYWDCEVFVMKKKILIRAFLGALIGIVISYLITIVISAVIGDGAFYPCVPSFAERYGNEATAVIIQTIFSAVLGGGFSMASLIWEMDDWSLLKQTGVYFVIITILMMTVAYICEWMEHSLRGVLSYFGIFFAIFVVIWIIRYFSWKIRISKIKEKLIKNE